MFKPMLSATVTDVTVAIIDDCGVVDVELHSLRSAPLNASRPTCEVRMQTGANTFEVDSDITDMIDWYYVVSYERKLLCTS